MVVAAQPGQVVEASGPGRRPARHVVDLQVMAGVAAGHDAFGVSSEEGGALGGRRLAAEVDDGRDVDAVGNHRRQKRVSRHGPGRRHRDGPDAVHLADLAGGDLAPDQGVVVDPHDDLRRRPAFAGGGAGRRLRHGHQRVGGAGLVALPASRPAGVVEGLPLERRQAGPEPGEGVGGEAPVHPPRSIAVDPRPQGPALVKPAIALLLLPRRPGGGLNVAAGLPQPRQRTGAGPLDERGAGLRSGGHRPGDLAGRLRRQRPLLPGLTDLARALLQVLGGRQRGRRRADRTARRPCQPPGRGTVPGPPPRPTLRRPPGRQRFARLRQPLDPAEQAEEQLGIVASQRRRIQTSDHLRHGLGRRAQAIADRNVAGTHAHTMQPTDRV